MEMTSTSDRVPARLLSVNSLSSTGEILYRDDPWYCTLLCPLAEVYHLFSEWHMYRKMLYRLSVCMNTYGLIAVMVSCFLARGGLYGITIATNVITIAEIYSSSILERYIELRQGRVSYLLRCLKSTWSLILSIALTVLCTIALCIATGINMGTYQHYTETDEDDTDDYQSKVNQNTVGLALEIIYGFVKIVFFLTLMSVQFCCCIKEMHEGSSKKAKQQRDREESSSSHSSSGTDVETKV